MSAREVRKVIRVGGRSYAVTLPKKWCERLGIKPGSPLDLVLDEDGILLLVKNRGEGGEDLQIFLEAGSEEVLAEELAACYIEGITRIRIRGDAKRLNRLLNKLSRRLVGLVATGSLRSTYTDVVLPRSYISIRDLAERISSLITELFNALFEYIKSRRLQLLEEADSYFEMFDQLYYLGLRAAKRDLMRVEGEQALNVADFLIFLNEVRHLVNSLRRLANRLYDMGPEEVEAIVEPFMYVRKIAIEALALFAGGDTGRIPEILSLWKKLGDILKRSVFRDPVMNELNLMFEISSDIARMVVARCVRNRACRCRYFYPKLEGGEPPSVEGGAP